MDDELAAAERSVNRLGWWETRRFDRYRRWFESSMLLVLVVLYLVGFHAQQQTQDRVTLEATRNTARTVQTNAVLCVFRHDLEERVGQSQAFLRHHPHGFAGIPASAIRVSLMGQERTVRALRGLECAPPSRH